MFVMLLVMSVAFEQPEERSKALATAIRSVVGIVLAVVAIINIPMLSVASGTGSLRIQASLLRPASDTMRWQTFVDGWHLWIESPIFGQGLSAYVESQVPGADPLLIHHSVPLWLMSEMGLIGLAVGIAAFGYLVLSAIRLMRDPVYRVWGAGLLMVLICWGAASQVHDFAFQRTFWLFIALAFGLTPAAFVTESRRSEPGC